MEPELRGMERKDRAPGPAGPAVTLDSQALARRCPALPRRGTSLESKHRFLLLSSRRHPARMTGGQGDPGTTGGILGELTPCRQVVRGSRSSRVQFREYTEGCGPGDPVTEAQGERVG